jgi:hypothetical protein
MKTFAKLALAAAVTLAVSPAFAAGVAVYEVRVERSWSESTHRAITRATSRISRPASEPTHGAGYRLFAEGGTATAGLEMLSQKGQVSPFDKEIADAQGKGAVGSVFKLSPVRIAGGEARAEFKADDMHPMLSFAEMVAPSPDWFTGVASVELKRDGRWIDGETMPLYAWDSGTNDAKTYMAAKIAVQPFAPIALNRAPMFVRDGMPVPVGKVTIRKLREE